MRCVGYRQIWAALDAGGPVDTVKIREAGIAATRQLAKRQLTWLRGRPELRWLDPEGDAGELEHAFRLFLGGASPV